MLKLVIGSLCKYLDHRDSITSWIPVITVADRTNTVHICSKVRFIADVPIFTFIHLTVSAILEIINCYDLKQETDRPLSRRSRTRKNSDLTSYENLNIVMQNL